MFASPNPTPRIDRIAITWSCASAGCGMPFLSPTHASILPPAFDMPNKRQPSGYEMGQLITSSAYYFIRRSHQASYDRKPSFSRPNGELSSFTLAVVFNRTTGQRAWNAWRNVNNSSTFGAWSGRDLSLHRTRLRWDASPAYTSIGSLATFERHYPPWSVTGPVI